MSSIHRQIDPEIGGTAYTFLKPMPSIHQPRTDVATPLPPEIPSSIEQTLFPPRDVVPRPSVAGVSLGAYRIEEQIGRGGMGAVFRAADTRLERVVALKVLSPELSRDRSAVQRFQNEARAAARLDHDNIAQVHDVGHDQGLYFIAFEFVAGTNLRELLVVHGNRFSFEEAINYTLQIADALRQTAAADVVHRDIKPSNIIISPTGRAKLVDWGLARQNSQELSQELTQTGTTLGTFDYISPEQAVDPRNVDVRSDIYSLGCTLFHMLAGEPPYPSGSMFQKVVDHHRAEAPDPRERNPRIPDDLAKLVMRMMASDPNQRYATPEAVIHDLSVIANNLGLQPVMAQGVWGAPPQRESGLARAGWGWLGAFVSLLLLVWYLDRPRLPVEETTNIVPAASSPSSTASPDTSRIPATSAHTPTPNTSSRIAPDAPVEIPDSPDTPVAGYQQGFRSLAGSTAKDASSTASKNGATSSSDVARPTLGVASNQRLGDGVARAATSDQPGDVPFAVTAGEGGFLIKPANGGAVRRFRTLETACAEGGNGDVIELQFDGPAETVIEPFKISGKRLTIQSARGRRPVLTFGISEELARSGGLRAPRMITVSGTEGALDIDDVDLVLQIPPGSVTDRWSLFSLLEPRSIQLRGVSVTVDNPDRLPASVVEIARPAGSSMARAVVADRNPIDLLLERSLIRGRCDLVLHESADRVRLSLLQTALAINGTLYRRDVDEALPRPASGGDRGNEVSLQHVSAVLDEGLLLVDLGDQGETAPFNFECRDSILKVTGATRPLIFMSGRGELDKYIGLLPKWRGQNTFYDLSSAFWEVHAQGRDGLIIRRWEFPQFQQLWSGEESLTTAPLFQSQRSSAWSGDDYSRIVPQDFRLRTDGGANPPLRGASDGNDAGVDVTHPRFPANPPRIDRAQSASRLLRTLE